MSVAKNLRKLLAVVLSIVIASFSLPVNAAGPDDRIGSEIISLTGYEDTVSVAYGTEKADLPLPETLVVTVRLNGAIEVATPSNADNSEDEIETEVAVIWEAVNGYDKNIPGEYIFVASVDAEEYTVSVAPPVTTVVVEEQQPAEESPGVTMTITQETEYQNISAFALAGTGTENDPFIIESVTSWEDLQAMGGYYTVKGTVTITGRIAINGTAVLTLADGCVFTVDGGINVSDANSLTIDGEGELVATGNADCAGIGGGLDESGGTIIIDGGDIVATGGSGGAGIGSGRGSNGGYGGSVGDGGVIAINGGKVKATGAGNGAGIGGGGGYYDGNGGTITINGGTVTAISGLGSYNRSGAGIGGGGGSTGSDGGSITVSGGTVTATARGDGAGIGGGGGSNGSGGSISITGGEVTALSNGDGAGIGGGGDASTGQAGGNGGNITIGGDAQVDARSNGGAGIGGGSGALGGTGGTIIIDGGTVTAEGKGGAGIGGGRSTAVNPGGSGGDIEIRGGTVTATGSDGGAGIGGGSSDIRKGGDGGDIKISGGMVIASSAGGAAGIGYGTGDTGAGNAGDFQLDGNAVVYASDVSDSTDKDSGILFIGTQGSETGIVYGSMNLQDDTEIEAGQILTVPNGATLTVPDGVTLTNRGKIIVESGGALIVDGAVNNYGAITGNTSGDGPLQIPATLSMTVLKGSTADIESALDSGATFDSLITTTAVYGETVTVIVEAVDARPSSAPLQVDRLRAAETEVEINTVEFSLDDAVTLGSAEWLRGEYIHSAVLTMELTGNHWTSGAHTITSNSGGSAFQNNGSFIGFMEGSAETTLTVSKATQTLTANNLPLELSDSGYNLSGHAASTAGTNGGDVTYTVTSSGSTGAVISGSSLTVTGVGTANIKASAAGSAYYEPANANFTLTVTNNLGDADSAAILAAKSAVEIAFPKTDTQANVPDEQTAIARITAIIATLDLNGVSANVTKTGYTAPIAGTSTDADGTGGAYSFTVTLSRGIGAPQTTGTLVLSISATPYTAPQQHIPVTGIDGVPSTATAGTPLTLTGTVIPDNATNRAITWSVESAGAAGAEIVDGNILNTTAAGTATVKATILNGAAAASDYTQVFSISVDKAPTTPPKKPTPNPSPSSGDERNNSNSSSSSSSSGSSYTPRTNSTNSAATTPTLRKGDGYYDTMLGRSVGLRLYADWPVMGYTTGSVANRNRAVFEKWYTNKIQSIHFEREGKWERPVKVAAKIDLAGWDLERLVFYAYDPKLNRYTRIPNPDYWVDSKGYLHFTTEYAGEIIISEGELSS